MLTKKETSMKTTNEPHLYCKVSFHKVNFYFRLDADFEAHKKTTILIEEMKQLKLMKKLMYVLVII